MRKSKKKKNFNLKIFRYENLKNMRKLIWHHELGSVTLNLTFDNGDFEFKCLPLHATIL